MEHIKNEEELAITSTMDFIVPLKKLGVITRAVLECIFALHNPKRIIVVAPASEEDIFHIVIPHWDVGVVQFLSEERFFSRIGVTTEELLLEYDENRDGDQREPGWWIQQLIKLGASYLPDITENYVVWDGDLIAVRRWKLCERDAISGDIKFFIAILQEKAKSEFNTEQYAASMKALTHFDPLVPEGNGTFVAHHMVFNKTFTRELISRMIEISEEKEKAWPLLIMASSRIFYRFSEYKTYATFMIRFHPECFHYHPLSSFGVGGLRFRKAIPIIDDILSSYAFTNGGLSYRQITEYVDNNWKRISNHDARPAYIQLDHVYGLDLTNLNIFVSSGDTSVDTTITSLSQEEPEELARRLGCWEESDADLYCSDDETEEAYFVRKSDLAPPSSKNNNEIQLNGSLF